MSEILIGQYLFRRLKELGIECVHGVPGDYELALLDLVPTEGLTWVGTPNELVGAYAADGYAREKGAAALVTTFGPGELSALCGIGGSYCEFVPVVHIVGYPTTQAQASGLILHHTLGDVSYDHYINMSNELSCATTVLKNATNATEEIDRVLNAMMYHSRPAYIGISQDVAYTKVPSSLLDKKLITSLPADDPAIEDQAVNAIIERLELAKSPIIIVDGGAARGSWEKYVEGLVDALKVPFFTTLLGKGIVNEQHALYGGSYGGAGSFPGVAKIVEDSDCVVWLGNLPSDFNTGMFTEHVKNSVIIDMQRFNVNVAGTSYESKIVHLLPKLSEAIKNHSVLSTRSTQVQLSPPPEVPRPEAIEQDWLWSRISSFLQPGDIVVTETGTAQVGIQGTLCATGVRAWTQGVYGSIGYAAGAAIGASIAAKELGSSKRMIVFTGEGSLQLTVQAISLLNRHGIVPILFVLNNSGYTVERYFNGMDASYNDVPMWDYGTLFKGFSPGIKVGTYKVSKAAELDELLNNDEFQNTKYPLCIDMVMGPKDAPTLLKALFETKAKEAAAKAK